MAAVSAIKRLLLLLALAGALAFLAGVRAAHADAPPAEAFVQQSVDRGFDILKDGSMPVQDRDTRFRALVRSIVDFRRVAVFALGPYAHGASDQQIDRFVNAFGDYIVSMFGFDADQGTAAPHIAVTGSTVRGADDVLVNASVAGPDTASAAGVPALTFRVRKNADGHDMIVDILVGGISVAATQRDELSSYLQQHGGNIDELSAELERRATSK